MQRRDLQNINRALQQIGSLQGIPFKLSYAIARNTRKVLKELKDIDSASKKQREKIENIDDYENSRISKLKERANKDEEGKPITTPLVGGGFNYNVDEDQVEQLQKELEDEFPGVRKAIEDLSERTSDFMDEEVDIEWYTIKKEWLEKMEINSNLLLAVLEIIENNDD